MPKPFDPEKLRALLKAEGPESVLHIILEALAARERPRSRSDLRRLRDEIVHALKHVRSISREEFIQEFEKLHKLGAGTLTYPRGPHDVHRFDWALDYIEMARGALGLASRESEQKPHLSPVVRHFSAKHPSPGQVPVHSIPVQLSTGDLIFLPYGITDADIKKLTDVAKLVIAISAKAAV